MDQAGSGNGCSKAGAGVARTNGAARRAVAVMRRTDFSTPRARAVQRDEDDTDHEGGWLGAGCRR
jgi:hypothetical protein